MISPDETRGKTENIYLMGYFCAFFFFFYFIFFDISGVFVFLFVEGVADM